MPAPGGSGVQSALLRGPPGAGCEILRPRSLPGSRERRITPAKLLTFRRWQRSRRDSEDDRRCRMDATAEPPAFPWPPGWRLDPGIPRSDHASREPPEAWEPILTT